MPTTDERYQINIYDENDLSNIFQINHNNGVVQFKVPDNSNMTISGKSQFTGSTTCLIRHDDGILCGSGGTSLLDTGISVEDLGNNNYKLLNVFSINYSGASFYIDGDLDNKVTGIADLTIPVGAPNSVQPYIDPEHYILTIDNLNNLIPYYNSVPLTNADNVQWRLSYHTTEGDLTSIKSTIFSGTLTLDQSTGVYALKVNDGLEFPVNGWSAEREIAWIAVGGAPGLIPLGSHIAASPADFIGFNFDPSTLSLSAYCHSESSLETIFDGVDNSLSTLTTNLSNEITRATTQEGVLDAKIDAQILAVTNTDTANHNTQTAAIATETARAQQAEAAIQAAIDTETTRASGVETTIAATMSALAIKQQDDHDAQGAAISTETLRATNAETAIQADVDANEIKAAVEIDTLQVQHGSSSTSNTLVVGPDTLPSSTWVNMWVDNQPTNTGVQTLTMNSSTSAEFSLGGAMTWNSTGGGHLYCESHNNDDWITFTNPVNLTSFQMTQIPWEGYGPPGGSPSILIEFYDQSDSFMTSTGVNLGGTTWASWLTVTVNLTGVKKILFKAPSGAPYNNGFWPSIDNIVVSIATQNYYANTDQPAYFSFSMTTANISPSDTIKVTVGAYDIDEPAGNKTEVYIANDNPGDMFTGTKTLIGYLDGANNASSVSNFVLTSSQITDHIINGGANFYVLIVMDKTIGSAANPWSIQLESCALSFPICIQTNIDAANASLASEVARATASEVNLQTQINYVTSNTDPGSLDSMTEVVTYFNDGDSTHKQLLQLLINRVVCAEDVLNNVLDPDLPPLSVLLQSLYDSYVSSLTPASGCNGVWVYGTIGGQDGWSTLTNDYNQPDFFSGTSMLPGDQADRGNSIIGLFTEGNNDEEDGQVYQGARAWWFRRGYDSTSSGTPQSPNIEAFRSTGSDNIFRDTFQYSVTFRAHQAGDGSRISVVPGKADGTDRASNYLEIENRAGGLAVRHYLKDLGAGASWNGAYSDIVSGLAWDSWWTLEATCVNANPSSYDDSWTYVIKDSSGTPHTTLASQHGYYNKVREAFGLDYEAATRLKFTPRHANYNAAFMGLYFDNIRTSSWSSSNEAGTASTYCADFEGQQVAELQVTSNNVTMENFEVTGFVNIASTDAWNCTFKSCTFNGCEFKQNGTKYGNAGLGALVFENCVFSGLPSWDSLYLVCKSARLVNCSFSSISSCTIAFLGTPADPVEAHFQGCTWNALGSWGAFEVSGSVGAVTVIDNSFSGLPAVSYMGHALHLWSRTPYHLTMTGNKFNNVGAFWLLTNIGKLAPANGGVDTTGNADKKLYIPTASFAGNGGNGAAMIDIAGWQYTSPIYVDLRYTQGNTTAANAARDAGLTDYELAHANITPPVWTVADTTIFDTAFQIRDRNTADLTGSVTFSDGIARP